MNKLKLFTQKLQEKPTFHISLALWIFSLVIISTTFFFIIYYTLSNNYFYQMNLLEYATIFNSSSIKAGILTLLLIIFMLVPFILYLSRKLTIPLDCISKMASEISVGNFENRIEYQSNNEIGMLVYSFNTMANKLQNTYKELNDKILDLNAQKEEINLKNLKLEQVIEVNKTILKQLEDKNIELENSNKVNAAFLSTMSHELRTPMNSIIGYTEMIRDGNDGDINEEQKKDLTIILKSAEKLLGMINDILDLSRIEAGKVSYICKRFDLVKEIAALIEDIKGMAHSKNLNFIFNYESHIPDIYSDPVKINHIVSNILSNAIKFTDKGYVKVDIKLENEKFINISISDTGIGIPQNKIHSIFDEFTQIDSSSTRKYGGTGLGLAIANAFTIGLGGKLTVTSKLNEGSTFTIMLPFNNSNKLNEEKKDIVIDSEENTKNNKSKYDNNIVVITKNSNDFNSIKNILSKHNYNVTIIDYSNAVQTIRDILPNYIFIDIDLPCSNCNDGWITLLDLDHEKITKNIPKIVITTQMDNKLGFTLGATDYLIKPFNDNSILNSIKKCSYKKSRGYILIIDDEKDTINILTRVIRKNSAFGSLIVSSLKDVNSILESTNLPKIIIYNGNMNEIKSKDIIYLINNLSLDIPLITLVQQEISILEENFIKQYSRLIITKQDMRYSVLVAYIKKVMLELK